MSVVARRPVDMDDETPREKWGFYFGAAVTLVPAMIVAGFMPDWDVLPFAGWLAIAAVGGAIAGAIATTRPLIGVLSGALMGAGVLVGIWGYVNARAALTGNATFFKLELAIGALLGAAPGAILYWTAARDPDSDESHA
jgi:hypothetical protein